MLTKFFDVHSDKLLIFLTGWGCDDAQFANMCPNLSFDLLLCWDYSDITFEHKIDFSKYKEIYLLAYSAGVFVAGVIQDMLPHFVKSIALNGNPLMFDLHFGISSETLKVFRTLNLSNYMDFRKKYLVKSEEELEFFNNHSSIRSFESCNDELDKLEEIAKGVIKPYNFDVAILSDGDEIFNPETQKEYFTGKYKEVENAGHNLFYKFQTFQEIFEFIK